MIDAEEKKRRQQQYEKQLDELVDYARHLFSDFEPGPPEKERFEWIENNYDLGPFRKLWRGEYHAGEDMKEALLASMPEVLSGAEELVIRRPREEMFPLAMCLLFDETYGLAPHQQLDQKASEQGLEAVTPLLHFLDKKRAVKRKTVNHGKVEQSLLEQLKPLLEQARDAYSDTSLDWKVYNKAIETMEQVHFRAKLQKAEFDQYRTGPGGRGVETPEDRWRYASTGTDEMWRRGHSRERYS